MSTNLKSSVVEQPGQMLAKVLACAWRGLPAGPQISVEELTVITPLLLESGAGALAWWQIRHTKVGAISAALQLREAYRYQVLQADLYELVIKKAFLILRSEGIDPVLVKGWDAARLYQEMGLRPCGDIDLCVRPDQYLRAKAAMEKWTDRLFMVDLHEGFADLDSQSFDYLYARSKLIRLSESEVRVLSPEDHLRVLCFHFLRHDAYRPLWLCDIAAALEMRPANFDWTACLGQNKRRADWMACAIGLAHCLLGADINDTPVEYKAKRLPKWLISNVLKQWNTPGARNHGIWKHQAPMAYHFRHPTGLLRDVINRWPGPIEATVKIGGPINELPRLPFQLGYSIWRALRFICRLAMPSSSQNREMHQ